ncbi:MAG: serine/threonine-protein kinase [Terriglobia bacterium]
MIPESIGQYRLEGPLAESREGMLYRAVAQDTGLPVALKLVAADWFPSDGEREEFLQDAQAATKLSHPHLRQLYEVGESGGQLYLAMELLEGATLRSLLVGGPLESEAALAWGGEVAEALAAAHAAGVVHGSLTPAKVFITRESGVKVLDAGLWRLGTPARVDLSQEENLNQSGVPAALVAALAPEQIRGQEPDARSDIFALGTLLYHMTTGRNPFADANRVQAMHWVLGRTPPAASQLVPAMPAGLDELLSRALEKDPRGRYPDAGEAAAALRAVAAGEELPHVPARRVALRLTAPLWVAIGAAVILLVLWFLYLGLLGPR